jgi:hypothetical protein
VIWALSFIAARDMPVILLYGGGVVDMVIFSNYIDIYLVLTLR